MISSGSASSGTSLKAGTTWLVISLITGVSLSSQAVQYHFGDDSSVTTAIKSQSYLSVGAESFFSPDYEQSEEKNFSYLGVSFYHLQDEDTLVDAKNNSKDNTGLNGEIHGQFFSQVPIRSYIDINQLFWESNEFSVGRQKYNWSQADKDWSLGVFEPRLTVNPIYPERQGLTGVFAKITSGNTNPSQNFSKDFNKDSSQDTGKAKTENSQVPFELLLFGSPVFIPDQGPNYELKNGKFEEASPYFQTLPTQARIFDQTQEIKYRLVKPDSNKIIFQQSYAASLKIASDPSKKYSFSIRASTGYMPSSFLSTGVQPFINRQSNLQIDVQPQSFYHRVSSLDIEYNWLGLFLGVSGFKEQNMEPSYEPEWTYFKFDEANGVMPYLGYKNRYFNSRWSYLEVYGGHSKAIGPKQEEAKNLLPERFMWRRAHQLQIQTVPVFKRLRLSSTIQRDLDFDQSLVIFQMDLKFHKYWQLFLGGQALKVGNPQSPMYELENHDIVFSGVSYAM